MNSPLSKFTDKELTDELARRKSQDLYIIPVHNLQSPIDTWKVTTEGDVEGRTVKDLGIYTGHIADIALKLSKRSYYSLRFEPYREIDHAEGDEVHVTLDISTKTWDMSPSARRLSIAKFLRLSPAENNFSVEESNYYAAVKINRRPK